MAENDTAEAMNTDVRYVYGPRPVGAVVPKVTRSAFKRGQLAAAQLIADWDAIVGPKVASMTVPRRLHRGELTIGCAGPTAMHLHYEAVELINRINTHLGSATVHSLKFTQAGMPRAVTAGLASPPVAAREADEAVADLPDGDLKAALAALGRVVIGRSKYVSRHTKQP